jgi:YwiC-like protein
MGPGQDHIQPPNAQRAQRRVSFWPREHGAYVQLLGPILCALWVGPINLKALVLVAAASAVFLAHEPLLVLLGRRGQRARSLALLPARWRVLGLGSFALGVVAWSLASGELHPSALLVPLLLSVAAGVVVLRGGERSLAGQLLSGATLASFAIPVLAVEGHAFGGAVQFAGGWALVQATATCAARAYVHRRRQGAGALRRAAALTLCTLVACAALWRAGFLPPSFALACAPFALIALLLSTRMLELKSPKTLGWVLTGANLIAFVVFGVSAV